jgi:N-acetylneuraminate synthase
MVVLRRSSAIGNDMEKLNLSGRLIGPHELPYIIAEIGSNHNGDLELCRKLVETAKECGADAVKFQSWSKKSLICRAEYARNVTYEDKVRHFGSLAEMVEKYQFSVEQHGEIAEFCKKIGITFLSTPFSPEEVDLLDSLAVACFKIASMDINHLKLLEFVGGKKKPVILSTGMASLGEIERAIKVLQGNGSGPIALLHCISIYPPQYQNIHLRNIPMLSQAFNLPVGFSDHTIGTAIPLAAIALGACIIEKHFTLNKEMEGWDHWISADPHELQTIAFEAKNVFQALGSTVRVVTDAEMEKRKKFRRRLIVKRHMAKDEILTEGDIDFKRPGTGIAPDEMRYVIGRRVRRPLEEDEELEWSDLE